MEQGETEMNGSPAGDPKEIVDYLLGTLKDNEIRERIERQIMSDEEFATKIDVVEQELIEQYLDGELSADQARSFEKGFLSTPEGRRHLRLTENLRTYSAGAGNVLPQAKRSMFDWRATPSIQWLRFAVLAVIVAAATFGIWRFASSESATDKALADMRRAYSGQRPSEARLSAFPDHAPYSETRGRGGTVTDPAARDRARGYLSDATRGTPEAGSNHALAILYLAEGDIERAEQEFNIALKAQPDSARLHSDLGAMYLEKARPELFEWNPKGLDSLDLSLKHIDRAIELAPQMPEPRFNKALVLEAMKLPDQAKGAWEEYLEIDPGSKWADEARRHLQNLTETSAAELSADELEARFLDAMRRGDEVSASDLINNNRELIREKYLPQRLAMSYVNAPPDRRDELLSAMKYAGELELRWGDPFAKEIALFYARLPERSFNVAREAQFEIVVGYKKCLNEDYGDSVLNFKRAQGLFEKIGDPWEAEISRYFVAYALHNVEDVNQSLLELTKTADYARKGGYMWLEATVTYWLGGVNIKMGRHSEARRHHVHALLLAEKLGDSYSAQRNLSELARLGTISGQRSAALGYINRVLDENSRPGNSIRQSYRSLNSSTELLLELGLYNAARYVAAGTVTAAKATGSSFTLAMSFAKSADVEFKLGHYDAARGLMENAAFAAQSIENPDTRNKAIAYYHLKQGVLERETRNSKQARVHYENALEYYRNAAMPFFLVQAANGLLLTDVALGSTEQIEKGIQENIGLTEEYRDQIADEEEKTGYFDRSVGVYEIAAGFEFDRGRFEAAYDYAERASSRSLLDWLRRGRAAQGPGIGQLQIDAEPESLRSIRERMPASSQILQYSVFRDRVLAWMISRDKFASLELRISDRELAEKTGEYRRLIESRDEKAEILGRELYDLLIAPVKEYLDDSKQICLVPAAVLFTLPYAALVSPEGRPLIAQYEITYAPSSNVFLHITERAASLKPGRETLLAVGNPAFDRDAFDGLPYLSGAEREARSISEFYDGGRSLIRAEASKGAVRSAMTEADVLHFAGHYVVEPQSPMSSYLLLAADGPPESSKLSNAEMAGHDLSKVRLIVLAACRTGTESFTPGEGLTGLSRTFLAANVPLVIGSQWSVDSDATAELMIRFHKNRRLGRLQTAAALRAAQLELLNDPTGRYAAPYYWSAFAAYGGHAGF